MPRASHVLLAIVAASCSAAHDPGDAAGPRPDAFAADAFAADAFAADAFAADAFLDPRVPRPIAPLSTATVTSQTPTLRWALGAGSDGVHVDLCRDRALSVGCVAFDATGTSGRPTSPLAAGVWFWRISTRSGGTAAGLASAVWELSVGTRSAPTDVSWGTTLDVNGDGYADLAVGASGSGGVVAGRADVYFGSATGVDAMPTITLTGDDDFGASVASAGDVNGDGYVDLIVGTGRDAAHLYFGGPSGPSADAATSIVPPPHAGYGMYGGAAGDANADGYADIALTDGRYVWVFLGSPGGPAGTPAITLSSPDPPGPTGTDFGLAIASADMNADGYPDLIVGAARVDDLAGRAYVFLGGATGFSNVPQVTLAPPEAVAWFGASVACAGDVNGDGFADLAVGARDVGYPTYLYLGTATGVSTTPVTTVRCPDLGAAYGGQVAGVGDVDGDGLGDVAVVASAVRAGAGYVYFGDASGLRTAPAALDCPAAADGSFCSAVAGAGDVDGDGHADVVAGNYQGGHAYLFVAGPMGIGSAPAVILGAGDLYDHFGGSVARAEAPHRTRSRGPARQTPAGREVGRHRDARLALRGDRDAAVSLRALFGGRTARPAGSGASARLSARSRSSS